MNKKSVYKLFAFASAAFLIAWIVVTVLKKHEFGGWFLGLFFACLAVAIKGNRYLKGLSFTVIIFATVSIALYHPAYFQKWGGFDLQKLIIPLIQLIMFGMGT